MTMRLHGESLSVYSGYSGMRRDRRSTRLYSSGDVFSSDTRNLLQGLSPGQRHQMGMSEDHAAPIPFCGAYRFPRKGRKRYAPGAYEAILHKFLVVVWTRHFLLPLVRNGRLPSSGVREESGGAQKQRRAKKELDLMIRTKKRVSWIRYSPHW